MRPVKDSKTAGTAPVSVAVFMLSLAICLLSVLLPGFSDLLRGTVFRYGGSLYGRVTSLFPFSVGEIMLSAAVIWVFLLTAAFIVYAFRRPFGRERVPGFIYRFFSRSFLLFSFVFLIMTVNCYSLYHATGIEGGDGGGKEVTASGGSGLYDPSELRELRNEVVLKARDLSGEVGRDENGYAVFEQNGFDLQSAGERARREMAGLSDEYPLLSGFIVRPKPMFFSDLMSQSYMQGYYFPFSMEANYNARMQDTNIPFTMCHELSHTKGYISEDDANFLGFLACARSDDDYFRYSGYLGILWYVENEYRKATIKASGDPEITDTVRKDAGFLTEDAWQQVEDNAIVDTETVHKASDAFVEGNLKVNGVSQGMKIYSEVVRELLDYRREKGSLP